MSKNNFSVKILTCYVLLLVLSNCLENIADQSDICTIETDNEDYGNKSIEDIFSDNESVGTNAIRNISQLKRSPNKKNIKERRPDALRKFQKSITKEFEPIKIRFVPKFVNAEN